MKKDINIEDWNKLLQHPRLGEILLQHRKITIHQLEEALKEQEEQNHPLGQILLQKEIISKDELLELLELQIGISKMLNDSFDELKTLGNRDQVSKLIEVVEVEINANKDLE